MNLKYIVPLAILLVLIGCAQEPAQADKNSLKYFNAQYGIELQYPSDWIKVEEGIAPAIVVFARQETGTDVFIENVNVVVQQLTEPYTLEEYSALALDSVGQMIQGYKLAGYSDATVAGNPGKKLEYTSTTDAETVAFMQVWTIKENNVYVITYAAGTDDYATHKPTIQKIITSLKIQ
ncbi:DcrB-related protein [Candidatus Woesearchaeota archaeon]|nr:DcrB-related protein [Candidatus Woesearchaeota archaeon]